MQRHSVAISIVFVVVACGGSSGGGGTSDGTSSSTSAADTTTAADGTSTSSSTGAAASESSSADGTGNSEGGSTGGEVEFAGSCPLETHVGGFLAQYEPSYSAFSGSVADGVVPLNVLEQIGEDESCVLMRRNNPFCDPGCSAGESCDFDGNCVPYPINHDIGVVTVTGLAHEIMLDPVPPTFSYFYTMLPQPGFEPGDLITVEATGGDYSPMLMHGLGVDMIVPSVDELHLDNDTPLELGWTPGDPRTRVRVQIGVDQHGTTPATLICTAPADAGALTISGELLTQFLENGISGFPNADFHFETVDSMDVEPGCVDFVVRSHAHVNVFVTGHTPCNVPGDCPDGQTCDMMNQTCV